jgi:predicted secreted hydrolase
VKSVSHPRVAFEIFDEATRRDLARLLWQRELDPERIPAELARELTSEKNSPEAWGERMRRFLQYLSEHPLHRTRDESETYAALLPHCGSLSPLQAYALRSLLPRSANRGYEPVPAQAGFRFPQDHALKLNAQLGWHFLVGSCWDEDGHEYGVEAMFFGRAMFPPQLAAEYGLSALDNQTLELQLGISVAGGRRYEIKPIVAMGTSGLIRATGAPFSIKLGRNLIESQHAAALFPLHVKAWGVDEGGEASEELEIDLVLASGKEFLVQGAEGAMPSVDGLGTLYYSIPRIEIDPTASRLRIGARNVKLTRGLFWIDHQWGYLGVPQSEVMRAADNLWRPEAPGWDWFEAQFSGDRQLSAFAPHRPERADAFYRQTGPLPPPPMEVRVGAKFMNAAKQTTTIWGTLNVTDWIKAERSPNHERYPATRTWYPNRWEFTFPDLPDDLRSFTMVPIVEHGQTMFFADGEQISEGAVRLLSHIGEEIGRGFAESVGYADTGRNMLRLAGLPESPDTLRLVARTAPPLATRILNLLYVVTHRKQLREILSSAKGLEFFLEEAPTP